MGYYLLNSILLLSFLVSVIFLSQGGKIYKLCYLFGLLFFLVMNLCYLVYNSFWIRMYVCLFTPSCLVLGLSISLVIPCFPVVEPTSSGAATLSGVRLPGDVTSCVALYSR